MTHRSSRSLGRHQGVTLVEVAVSTTLVGVVLVAALETVGSAVRAARGSSEAVDGYTLAEDLLAEILAQPYEDPEGDTTGIGVEASEPVAALNRLALDDADDYHLWNATPPVLRDGTPIPGYDGWTREARVYYADADPATGTPANRATDEGLKRIRVEVVSPTGTVTRLHAFRSRHGALEGLTPFDTTLVRGVTVDLSTGGAAVHKGVALVNDPEAP
ncbi:type IV pilus modification PilV family protein [Botrimarina hoheduenensis]|uniref:Prepilin-type N-terminal cleavage/methylation domain-containing protein n=1 Tax=Botrimarina hoheduenensis TaxID=2528000 RepID=A0A5C5WBV7_9BACT|nr:hypothetical protein [Botrimarina hoheduenensis]TWT47569.1 hypothetical protein Pla111_11840 [Botrimarina hoheduenensis]